jgi:hypothetical protein
MKATTLKELGWIHDCDVFGVLYDTSNDADRSIKMTMSCPKDLGYEPWAGKNLTLIATGVALMDFITHNVV